MSLTDFLKSKQSFNQTNQDKLIEIESSRIPNLDEGSLKTFKKLIQNDLQMLQFEDDLTTFSLSGNEIGSFKISVTPFIFQNTNCFKVHAKSNGTLENVPCGTEINAVINESLETLEQDHFEYIKFPNNQFERKTILTLENNNEYIISKTENVQMETKKSNFSIKKSLMTGFISESSNILLQRLMIQNNIYDPCTLFTFDSDMNPCLANYKPLDTRIVQIADEDIKVKGIERTVESISDIPTTWQIYFSSDGHMINRVQVGSPAIMRTISKPKPIEIDEYLPKLVIEKKELNPDEDFELKSKYIERTDELKNDYDQYLTDHPEVKLLMADYMQSLLSFKPNDVISFSAKYFAPYYCKTSSNKLMPLLKQQINIPKYKT